MVQDFIKLMLKRGYPSSSIRVERSEGGIRFDIGVYSISGALIQVFEIKRFNCISIAEGIKTWERLNAQFEVKKLFPEIYIVSIEDNGYQITIMVDGKPVSYVEGTTDYDSVLKYERALARYKKRIEEKGESSKMLEFLKKCSWIVAGCLSLCVVASLCCYIFHVCFPLSFELLAFLGLIYILMIIPVIFPYLKRVKFWSIEVDLINKELFEMMERRNGE